jgi:endonuclease YncB( thermonuclease family)
MKRKSHRNWANAHHRSSMLNKKRGRGNDPVVMLLSTVFVISVGLAVFVWPTSSVSNDNTSAGGFSCSVASITDGDTLRCDDGTRVRLHAVAARESDETCSIGHPCPSASAAAATDKLAELASGQTLQCQKTGTSYERVTAICRNEANTEINCAMVRSGTALVWPKFNEQRPICQ